MCIQNSTEYVPRRYSLPLSLILGWQKVLLYGKYVAYTLLPLSIADTWVRLCKETL